MTRPAWLMPTAKAALALAILGFVGWQFYRDSGDLRQITWHPGWIALSVALYLPALGFSAGFWFLLLHVFGQNPSAFAAVRAYYIGHLGKYVPGKAIALVMRATLVRGPGVSLTAAGITSLYEVLTTMASGALLAAVVFALDPPTMEGLRIPPYLTGLLLLAVCGVPLMPGVFNFLVARGARRFQAIGTPPPLRIRTLLAGIALTLVGWTLLGLSTWAGLNAVLATPIRFTPGVWVQLSAIIALAWVGGFLALIMPGGLGVRELVLYALLAPYGARPEIVAAVLLMRVAWTLAELVFAGILYLVPPDRVS